MMTETGRVPTRTGARGFTLIEVLVALVVIALALGALVDATSSQARNAAYLVDRTFAQWVAVDALAVYRAERRWPEAGDTRGRAELAGRSWRWEMVTETTDDPDLRRVEVAVSSDDAKGAPLTRFVAYLGRPPGAAE